MGSRAALLSAWLRLSRPRDWATSKLPFITASVLWTGAGALSVVSVIMMIAAIAAVAAFGYGTNEIADRWSDARAGKRNRAVELGGLGRGLFLAVTSSSSGILVAVQAPDLRAPALWLGAITLSVAYSTPPLRLKERGLLGILAAAAAQWALPVLMISAACDRAPLRGDVWILALLGFAIGVRWMAVHQFADVRGDRISGVRTYASEGGSITEVLGWAFRAELGLLLVVLIASWPKSFPAAVALALWALKSALGRAAGVSFRDAIATYERAPLSDYYFLLLPVALAVGRAANDPEFLVLVSLFLLLGAGQIGRALREWRAAAA